MQMQNEILDSLGVIISSKPIHKNDDALPRTTTLNYISYLRNVSSIGLSEIVSAMAPCPWSYLEIADKLSKSLSNIQTQIYKKWIQFYSSDESRKQVEEIKKILNILAKEASEKDKMEMEKYFATACKYEYLFWDMVYYHQLCK
jgi:thiaminase (transcriptional activator TenA)